MLKTGWFSGRISLLSFKHEPYHQRSHILDSCITNYNITSAPKQSAPKETLKEQVEILETPSKLQIF